MACISNCFRTCVASTDNGLIRGLFGNCDGVSASGVSGVTVNSRSNDCFYSSRLCGNVAFCANAGSSTAPGGLPTSIGGCLFTCFANGSDRCVHFTISSSNRGFRTLGNGESFVGRAAARSCPGGSNIPSANSNATTANRTESPCVFHTRSNDCCVLTASVGSIGNSS